jgi:hypothetical protein
MILYERRNTYRNEPTRTLKCKLVEITIPWRDAVIENKDENEPNTRVQI